MLDGYARQTAEASTFELIVVTDAADPDPAAVERAIGSREFSVRRITGPEPGLSANRNAGWRAARGRLVMFTDNDTIPVSEVVSEHLSWHRRYPAEEVGVVGLVRWAPELEVSTFMRWLDMGLQFNFANFDTTELPWGAFVGANSSLKRTFVERVGDFDQEHFPYGYEDTDWAYRGSKLGLRMVYSRRAVVDHVRPMSFDFYVRRIRRVAAAEYTFTQLHPEVSPWWHDRFRRAAESAPARGRGIRLAPFVPRKVPWLGRKVWGSVDAYYRQALAPHFLSAWEEAAAGGGGPAQPDLSEFATESSGGS